MVVEAACGSRDLKLLVGISKNQDGENRQCAGLAYQPPRPFRHFAVFLTCSGKHTHPMMSPSLASSTGLRYPCEPSSGIHATGVINQVYILGKCLWLCCPSSQN